jgi:nucleoside-diphosphate-sugar epimerase
MKALFIGGTGTISAAISRRLLSEGWDLYLLNRGNRNTTLAAGGGKAGSLTEIHCDIANEAEAAQKLAGLSFDVVADFIAFKAEQLERDYRLFKDKTKQFIFISSASAYQKPLSSYLITESTPLSNPLWDYSRNKIAGEEYLLKLYREAGFPITIVRPSHTYDERSLPMGAHGTKGGWSVVKRIREGKPVIIHGDGSSLWTVTHNSDFARGFAGLMGNIHAIGEAVHITSDESLTWNQIYQAVADALGVPLKAVHVSSEFLAAAGPGFGFTGGLLGDKANTVVFDNTTLKRLVPGFTAAIRFDQGVRIALDYILSHPECQKEDPEFDAWTDKVIAAQEQALAACK